MIHSLRLLTVLILQSLCIFPLAAETDAGRLLSSEEQACRANTRTEIERLYCRVKFDLGKTTLPNLGAFRQQSERMQALLLKPHLRNTDISLPKLTPKKSTVKRPSKPNVAKKQRNDRNTLRRDTQTHAALTQCSLEKRTIQCNDKTYTLATNQQNNNLNPKALTAANQLVFPDKEQGEFKDDSVSRYLSQMYPIYIEKMLNIGLGDSTMSYTKFVEVYWLGKKQNHNFSKRFQKMFDQLKSEKRSIGTIARYNNAYPDTIKSCMHTHKHIIVCDNKAQNWIYVLR